MLLNFDATGPGNLTVSLETPEMQSQDLGFALSGNPTFRVDTNIFQGAKAEGVWTLNLLASPVASGWIVASAPLTFLSLSFDQC